MSSTRREDIRDFVEARRRGQFFLAKAYADLLAKKVARKEES